MSLPVIVNPVPQMDVLDAPSSRMDSTDAVPSHDTPISLGLHPSSRMDSINGVGTTISLGSPDVAPLALPQWTPPHHEVRGWALRKPSCVPGLHLFLQ